MRKKRAFLILIIAIISSIAILMPCTATASSHGFSSPNAEYAAISQTQSTDSTLSSLYEGYTTISQTQSTGSTLSSLYAGYAALIDADSGRVLFEKNGYTKVPNASTTKILTCLAALELGSHDDIIEVSPYAASMPDVQLNLIAGDSYRLNDLLYSLMLQSHNDSAVAIAEELAAKYLQSQTPITEAALRTKDESKYLVSLFVNYMNRRATDFGCTDTYFITPNGLDASDENDFHGTSAIDLAIIMSECIKNADFIEITQTVRHVFSNIDGTKNHTVTNANSFLSMMDGIISGKTGFTNGAGYCYTCAYKDEDRTLVSVVLACGWPYNKTYKWTDTRCLIEYGKTRYVKRTIFNEIENLTSIPVPNGIETSVSLYVPESLTALLSDDDTVNVTYSIPGELIAPISEDTEVGSAYIYINDQLYETLPILTASGTDVWRWGYCARIIADIFFLKVHKPH